MPPAIPRTPAQEAALDELTDLLADLAAEDVLAEADDPPPGDAAVTQRSSDVS